MHVTNITDEYGKITSSNYTKILNDYDNMTLSNCTNNERKINIIVPGLLFTIPCGLSFLCVLSFKVYIIINPLINSKSIWKNVFTQLIQFVVL